MSKLAAATEEAASKRRAWRKANRRKVQHTPGNEFTVTRESGS